MEAHTCNPSTVMWILGAHGTAFPAFIVNSWLVQERLPQQIPWDVPKIWKCYYVVSEIFLSHLGPKPHGRGFSQQNNPVLCCSISISLSRGYFLVRLAYDTKTIHLVDCSDGSSSIIEIGVSSRREWSQLSSQNQAYYNHTCITHSDGENRKFPHLQEDIFI